MRRAATPIVGRTTFYAPDGTGRDNYIAFNNGGMTNPKPQGYVVGPRIFKYIFRWIWFKTSYSFTRSVY